MEQRQLSSNKLADLEKRSGEGLKLIRGRICERWCNIHTYIHYLFDFWYRWVYSHSCSPLPHLSAGAGLIHHELLHVHLLGSVLRLPGRLSGQGVCSLRLRLGDPRGEENDAFAYSMWLSYLSLVGATKSLLHESQLSALGCLEFPHNDSSSAIFFIQELFDR